ncbi:hypothetical protein L0U85_11120 [Glycomyces sp. L485]|uniref:hypothetical protein n=1 Tax=Glycomyces sp. L485 TaxID=2909235 RepID=UPI001F4BA543|nr:hypothetical protein [Glycomyces sp. L485]MCH7231394.1 hypothetical protein [Glycomyces sp. L485]
MGLIMRGCEITRRLGVPRLLLGAALGAFGSLLLGALSMATIAWASDETAETTGLAALTDPLTAEVSDMSRLAARLVPQNQQGHRTPADEGTSPGLVSGLTEPVGSLVEEPVESVQTALHDEARTDLSNGMSVGDSAAGVATPLLGSLVKETSSVLERPDEVVSGVYETVAPATEEVNALARLVTDGLVPPRDATLPGSVLASGQGQPSLTSLQQVSDSTEVAAALQQGVSYDRSAADLECTAASAEAQETAADDKVLRALGAKVARPWSDHGPAMPDLKIIPGGAAGSTAGISVDGGNAAVDVSPATAGEQVSFARAVIRESGWPMDRAAELSVAPD